MDTGAEIGIWTEGSGGGGGGADLGAACAAKIGVEVSVDARLVVGCEADGLLLVRGSDDRGSDGMDTIRPAENTVGAADVITG